MVSIPIGCLFCLLYTWAVTWVESSPGLYGFIKTAARLPLTGTPTVALLLSRGSYIPLGRLLPNITLYGPANLKVWLSLRSTSSLWAIHMVPRYLTTAKLIPFPDDLLQFPDDLLIPDSQHIIFILCHLSLFICMTKFHIMKKP